RCRSVCLVKIQPPLNVLNQRVLPLNKASDDCLRLGRVNRPFLRKTDHLSEKPRADTNSHARIHLVWIDLIRIVTSASVAGDIVNEAAGAWYQQSKCVVNSTFR